MFQMVETHRESHPFTPSYPGQQAPGTVIFRDRARKITVRHDHTHRGGSLYATGHVTVWNLNNGESFTYYTTRPPIDAESAANMAWYKRDAISFEPLEAPVEAIKTFDGTDLAEIAPAEGSRNGWTYSSYLRVGRAKLADVKRGGSVLYGIYGARETAKGWEMFLQREGTENADGGMTGLSLLSTSCDMEPYIWAPAAGFAEIRIF